MPTSTVSDEPAIRSAEVNTRSLVKNGEADKHSVNKSSETMNSKLSTFTGKGKLFIPKADDQDGNTVKEGQPRKTPSSVRKMISAFEFNTTQDTKSRNKPPPPKSPVTKLGFENPTHDLLSDEVIVSATKKLLEMSSEIVVSPSFFSELRQKVTAKKRQISSDVVEIITIAPERGLAEATADELVNKPLEDETSVSAVDAFEAAPLDIRTEDMTSREDDTMVPKVETRDNIDLEDKELQNKDKQFFGDKINLAAVEKDNFNRTHCVSEIEFQKPPQDQMTSLYGETENSISAEYTLFVMKDCIDSESDRTATDHGESFDDHPVKQLVADDIHCDYRNSGNRFIKAISEKEHQYEDPHHVKMGTNSTKKLEPSKCSTEWLPTCGPPSSWVFPDEPIVSCIGPSSTHLTNSIGGFIVDASILAGEHSIPSARKICQENKAVDEPSRSPGLNDSADGGNPNGQFAQAIKIAIIVAFGALVFFSRQRNYR
ncbi:unnamed protein product [Rhodiola kirilowii]